MKILKLSYLYNIQYTERRAKYSEIQNTQKNLSILYSNTYTHAYTHVHVHTQTHTVHTHSQTSTNTNTITYRNTYTYCTHIIMFMLFYHCMHFRRIQNNIPYICISPARMHLQHAAYLCEQNWTANFTLVINNVTAACTFSKSPPTQYLGGSDEHTSNISITWAPTRAGRQASGVVNRAIHSSFFPITHYNSPGGVVGISSACCYCGLW